MAISEAARYCLSKLGFALGDPWTPTVIRKLRSWAKMGFTVQDILEIKTYLENDPRLWRRDLTHYRMKADKPATKSFKETQEFSSIGDILRSKSD